MRKTPRFGRLALAIVLATAAFTPQAMAVPIGVNYQAYLTDTDGAAISGNVTVTFAVYNVPNGGVPSWGQTESLDVDQGLVTVTLADMTNPFPVGLFDGPVYMGIFVNGEEMLPRRAFTSTAFSYKASDADTLSGATAASLDESPEVAALQGDLSLLDTRVMAIETMDPVQITGGGATTVSGTYPNFVVSSTDNVDDADASTTNELQTLSLSGSTLSVSPGGGSVSLAALDSPWSTSGSDLYFNAGRVGIGDNTPAATLTVGSGDKLQVFGADGDVRLNDDQGTLQFPATSGSNAPMIQMFSSGTSNSTRMLVAHSPNFASWGLRYDDVSDTFDWIGDGLPVMQIGLSSPQRVGVGTFTPEAKFHVVGDSSSGNGQIKLTETQFDFARITFDSTDETDFWELAARTNSNPSSADLNFFHSEAGNILSMDARGHVGIMDSSPSYSLEVNGNGGARTVNVYNNLPTTTGTTSNYGVISLLTQATNTGFPRLYNLYGSTTDSDSYISYGAYGRADNASNFNYGVYGRASTTNGYAVYASGNTFSTGSYLPSDAKLKTGVKAIERGVASLMALQPRSYAYKTQSYDFMNLPDGPQYGFVAQEFEESFPDLVKASYQAYDEATADSPEGQGLEFKAINYTGLIPVMVSAIQEQQRTIEAQDATIRSLQERLSALETKIGK